jgi:exodeoxyribonuclease-5
MEPSSELRKPKKPDQSILIGQQNDAFNSLLNFLDSGESMFCLEGFAGTGKSFLTNMLLEHNIAKHGSFICMSAPTNKAVSVIKRMAEFSSDNLSYNTIHSLLGLRPFITDHGTEMFVKDTQSKNKVGEFDLIVVDEASQLDDQLFVYLMEELDNHPHLKLIFVGDGKQLPPVNHSSSIPMCPEKRKAYKIGYTNLTEIVRQKEGNPIIELSKQFRDKVYNPKMDLNAEREGIVVVTTKNRKAVLKKLFCSEAYEKDGDFCRATTWRNDTVNFYNEEIRKMIYKERIRKKVKGYRDEGLTNDAMIPLLTKEFPFWKNGKMNLPKYLVGDKLIVDKPIFDVDTNQITFQTNEELIIEDYTIENRMGKEKMYKCYIADVKNIFSGKKELLEMVHEDDDAKYEQHKNKLRQMALNNKKGSKPARAAWVHYYDLDKRFARLKYAPCLTTYKSQGSTYENVILITPDILSHPKEQEMFQHLYVGVTRARKRAFLFVH